MQIITLILSILAFLAAGGALYLMLKERQHNRAMAEGNKTFKKTLTSYVTREINKAAEEIAAGVRESLNHMDTRITRANKAVDGIAADVRENADRINARIAKTNQAVMLVNKREKENSERIEKLENGCVPDFEEALQAVNAVNDMNRGIAGIFGFDPMEALKKSRQEVGNGQK